jgi:integrase
VKRNRSRRETLEAIANYRIRGGAVGLTQRDERRAEELVRAAVGPMAYFQRNSVYPYLRGATELVQWAHERGYELTLETVFCENLVWAFLAQRPKGSLDHSAHLWRLVRAHGPVSPAANAAGRTPRQVYQSPYSPDEMAALLEFAQSLTNEYRRTTLLMLVTLGAGCGITRQRVRGVRASDVHLHGDAMFVKVGHCAKVLPAFAELLAAACTRQPEGNLVPSGKTNVTERCAGWTEGRRGVPVFSTDRLRATYIVALMDDGASLTELMAWTGLKGCDALEPYLHFVKVEASGCSFTGRP